MIHQLTLQELCHWEDHGATWRMLELDDDSVSVEMCTCSGELVDLRHSRERALIDYVRGRSVPDGDEPPGDSSRS